MKVLVLVGLVSVVILLATTTEMHAKNIFVDPSKQESGGDGSIKNPWRSLKDVLDREELQPGDTIYLRTGDYGALWINDRRNEAPVTIAADQDHAPRFTSIRVSASSNWHLYGLSVSPSLEQSNAQRTLIEIEEDADAITIEKFSIMSARDSARWTAADWNARAANGIVAGGTKITLRGNRLRNINHGITISASDSVVENNLIENFSGDGIRGLGNHTTYRSNTIKNCYGVNDNHDDGFQSWSIGEDGKPGNGEVVGVVISGNKIINYDDPDQPFRCALQGIGLFDGIHADYVIENNVVIVDHWHGITVMGARNVRIINNSVIDPNDTLPGPPWITITKHENGASPQGSFIVNNLAPSFNSRGFSKGKFPTSRKGVSSSHNMQVKNPEVIFQDAANGDLRLKPGSRPVDAGTSSMAPVTDIDGNPRLKGDNVDLGAYELQ